MVAASLELELEDRDARAGRLPLVGGNLCLNFTNTVSGLREGEHEQNHLHTYENLIAWACHARALSLEEGRKLLRHSMADPAGGGRALHRAVGLRDVVHDIFGAIAHQSPVPQRALETLNGALVDVLRHARIVESETGFAWGWDDLTTRLDAPLWPILRSAADLLTLGRVDRVKQCPYPHCGWLFIDSSKNKSRRWCEMSVCGNRTKARRHYLREKRLVA